VHRTAPTREVERLRIDDHVVGPLRHEGLLIFHSFPLRFPRRGTRAVGARFFSDADRVWQPPVVVFRVFLLVHALRHPSSKPLRTLMTRIGPKCIRPPAESPPDGTTVVRFGASPSLESAARAPVILVCWALRGRRRPVIGRGPVRLFDPKNRFSGRERKYNRGPLLPRNGTAGAVRASPGRPPLAIVFRNGGAFRKLADDRAPAQALTISAFFRPATEKAPYSAVWCKRHIETGPLGWAVRGPLVPRG